MTFVLAIGGLALLIAGGEALVRGASRMAMAAGISPLVIGLTVVAFGTSAPELGVSIIAALDDKSDIAIGNVVGSGIVNILFILGVAALIAPISVSRQLIRWDVPVMIGVSVLAYGLSLDGVVSMLDGTLLSSGLILYTLWSIRLGRREAQTERSETRSTPAPGGTSLGNIGRMVIGLIMLVFGSRLLVESSVVVARSLGVSELVIGLTIVAIGTSLPEITTSIIAGIRGERDIAVGNVVGSNIFNILLVLGSAALVVPDGLAVAPAMTTFDFPVLIAVSLACFPVFLHEGSINRWEGGLFLGYYVAYTVFLILDSTHHDALPMYSSIMLYFVIPLSAATVIAVTLRYVRRTGTARSRNP